VTMSDGDESGFSTKETTLYMWRIETIRMALMQDTMLSPLFILFSLVLFPDLHFQLRALTSASQPPWSWPLYRLRLSIGREM